MEKEPENKTGICLRAFALLLLSVFLSSGVCAEEPRDTLQGLNASMQAVYHLVTRGEFEAARGALEELRQAYPEQVMISVMYADLLKFTGEYNGAGRVYEEILEKTGDETVRRSISTEIEKLQAMKHLQSEIRENTPSWAAAALMEKERFVYKSNLPAPVIEDLNGDLENLAGRITSLLEKDFGIRSEDSPGRGTVWVPARFEETLEVLEDSGISRVRWLAYYPVHYDTGNRRILAVYQGYLDAYAWIPPLAESLFPGAGFVQPSLIFEKGMAAYIREKLSPESSRMEILQELERIRWMSGPEGWNSLQILFDQWHRLENVQSPADYVAEETLFRLMAWSFVRWLSASGGDLEKEFLRKWLEFEKGGTAFDRRQLEAFWGDQLTSDQMRALDQSWRAFNENRESAS